MNLRPSDSGTLIRAANFLVMFFVAFGLVFRTFSLGTQNPPWVGILVLVVVICNSLYLHKNGSDRIASRVLVAVLLFGIVLAGTRSGGFAGPIVLVAPIIPVFAIVLLSTRAGWITMALVAGILSAFFVVQLSGHMPPTYYSESGDILGRYLALLISCFVGTWVTWSYAETKRELLASNEYIANTDHLTGIPNRRAAMECLERESNRARRSGNAISLVVADVDHFKRYNDVNGHPAGDACLRDIATTLIGCARRPTDLVGRYGGEEFIAVLPDTDVSGALELAERMRLAIIAQALPYDAGKDEMVSMTFGLSTAIGKEASAETLLRDADKALYEGKEQGRNRVVSHQIQS